jgi:EAL domain-containing protein (putative c-di-GMP-specific phosphodiesterase class I)
MTNGDRIFVAYLRTEREGIHGATDGALPLLLSKPGARRARALHLSGRGKHLFFKSAAKRTSTAAAAAPAPSPAAIQSGPLTVEALGQQLREVLPTRRLQSVSLCDHEANVLWLSEGALGPDEHSLVTEALALLAADTSLPCHEMGLEDGRLALFLPVRSPTGAPVGIAMILADRKSVGDDTLERMMAAPVRAIMQRLAVLLKPSDLRSGGTARVPVLHLDEDIELAEAVDALMPPAARAPVAAPAAPVVATPPVVAAAPIIAVAAVSVITAEEIDDILQFDPAPEVVPPAPRQEKPVMAPVKHARPQPVNLELEDTHAGPAESLDMVELDFEPPPPKGPAARSPTRPAAAAAAPAAPAAAPKPAAEPAPVIPVVRVSAPARVAPPPVPTPAAAPAAAPSVSHAPAVNDPNLMLELLPFAKLRAGGQTRRYQVLSRSSMSQRDPAAFDALVLQRLLGWLAAHRASWNSQPTSFTVNLSIATLEDERFAQKMAAALNTHGIAADCIGFEIAEALCTQRRAQVERFITQCDKVGAWVVIDDFSFDSQVLPLLRSKSLRLVKIDPKLTSNALKDKLAQAMVVATVQAAKVLGIHCSAKKVDSQAALQWLTAIGCDFAQGQALARAQPLDALASSPDPTGITAMAMPT